MSICISIYMRVYICMSIYIYSILSRCKVKEDQMVRVMASKFTLDAEVGVE